MVCAQREGHEVLGARVCRSDIFIANLDFGRPQFDNMYKVFIGYTMVRACL